MIRRALILGFLLAASSTVAQTVVIDNDASCDIANLPAATLLLPYFEVDAFSPSGFGETTLFTVTNTSHLPQVARVTLWTDLAYPGLSFNVFLTGYDVQSINLYDVFTQGWIGGDRLKPGDLSGRDNPIVDEESCATMPVRFDDATVARLQRLFTTGKGVAGCAAVGTTHSHLVGYATVDVVGSCTTTMPIDPAYFSEDIRFDNVLIGDYMQVSGDDRGSAQGGSMVHIRAIPEGGRPHQREVDPRFEVTLSRTFYDRYQSRDLPRFDARQPLPSIFAARWADDALAPGFWTKYKIWREGVDMTATCSEYEANRRMEFVEIVRFDEEENPLATPPCECNSPIIPPDPILPATALVDAWDEAVFPSNVDDAGAGWMYFNLSFKDGERASEQAWVVASMRQDYYSRYSADVDASALANGCSPLRGVSDERRDPIGPPTGNDASCDIAALPAATLLLPYFEVDIDSPARSDYSGETTIFTVTNTSQLPQVARVTLWTDLAYPVFAFDIYLTGYDVQSINLFDIIVRGEIAADSGADPYTTGSGVSPVGALSGTSATLEYDNPLLDEADCFYASPLGLPKSLVDRMQSAFVLGRLPGGGSMPGCSTVGGRHANAVGYATIDVVGACTSSLPTDASYFADEIRFDNVLVGDYIQMKDEDADVDDDFAQSSAMVHIRAIPEGGHPRNRRRDPDYAVQFPSTFYGAYQRGDRRADARQPLPSVFAARWIDGSANGFDTRYKIWRQALNAHTGCGAFEINARPYVEVVRFDEDENPLSSAEGCDVLPCIPETRLLRTTNLASSRNEFLFPRNPDDSPGGWFYINLDDAEHDGKAAQAWVVSSMRAGHRFFVDMDAAALGNGCSAPVAAGRRIGPLPNRR